MTIRIGDEAPDFVAETTHGTISFHEWLGDSWAVLFSHPKDFTPVCTTELGQLAGLAREFERRGTRILGLSADSLDDHRAWMRDIEATQGHAVRYPLVADTDLSVAKLYGMLPAADAPGRRTAMDNATVRSVFVIGPDRQVKAIMVYPMSSGRNFQEVLRLLDSLQLTATHAVATPAGWSPGEEVIIPTSVTDEQARARHPGGFTTHVPYLRTVKLPR